MAMLERTLTGNFDQVLRTLDQAILNGSMSASYEDGTVYTMGDVRCAVRMYERYSYTGGNRVALCMTLTGQGDQLRLTAAMIDLDFLKQINDTHGHKAGDIVLKVVADLLRRQCRHRRRQSGHVLQAQHLGRGSLFGHSGPGHRQTLRGDIPHANPHSPPPRTGV